MGTGDTWQNVGHSVYKPATCRTRRLYCDGTARRDRGEMSQFCYPFICEEGRRADRRDHPCANRRNRVIGREGMGASSCGRKIVV